MIPKPSKELIKLWHIKLKDSGFEDIEYFSKSGEPKEWMKSNSKFRCEEAALPYTPSQMSDADTIFLSDRDYYLDAGHLLNEDVFDSQEHRRVWELHAAGCSFRTIEKDPELDMSHTKAKRIVDLYKKRHFNLTTKRKR